MSKSRSSSSAVTANAQIWKQPKGGFLMKVTSNDNIISWLSYDSVKEEISDGILDSIEDAVGKSRTKGLKLKLTFGKSFTTIKIDGQTFLDLDDNKPTAYEIL